MVVAGDTRLRGDSFTDLRTDRERVRDPSSMGSPPVMLDEILVAALWNASGPCGRLKDVVCAVVDDAQHLFEFAESEGPRQLNKR
jgi:hypothetical protein